jgi:hypothetical protein
LPDLNIFDQFNFDEMNINSEDINQNNKKMDVINSEESDISPNYRASNPYQDSSNENTENTPDRRSVPELKEAVRDKYQEMAQIGTQLQQVPEIGISKEIS